MKTVEGFRLRTMLGEHIIAGEGLAQINFNKIISLNESAAYLWETVSGKEFTVEDLAAALVEKYGIEKELALKDSEAIAKKWIEAGIVTE